MMTNKYILGAISALITFIFFLVLFFIIKHEYFAIIAVAFYAIAFTGFFITRHGIALVNVAALTLAILVNAYWAGWLPI